MSLGVTYIPIWGRPQEVGRKHPGDVGRGRPLVLHIGPYEDLPWTLYFYVLGMSVVDVLGKSARDVPRHYIEDYMGTSRGRLSKTSSGRNFSESGYCILVKKDKVFLSYVY